jgi:hypothetical protein
MPNATDILDGLSMIANRTTGVAVGWHLVIAAALVALGAGWHPSQRTARLLIGMPLASVAAVAFAFANPFNGLVFAASAMALTALAMMEDRRPVLRGSAWAFGSGIASITFGWVYPHFLDGHPTAYLYAAPVGLVPCPTLAVAIGFALLGNGLGARAWSLTLAAVGLFYGLFGLLRLGVWLDIGLVNGAIALIAAVLRSNSHAPDPASSTSIKSPTIASARSEDVKSENSFSMTSSRMRSSQQVKTVE